MATRTLEIQNETEKPSVPMTVVSSGLYSTELAEGYSWPITAGIRPTHKQTLSLGGLGLWLLALTTITTPIVYVDPQRDLLHSGSSSISWSIHKRRGRSLSLRQAYEMAMRILTETDQRLTQERFTEARFTIGPWEDQ